MPSARSKLDRLDSFSDQTAVWRSSLILASADWLVGGIRGVFGDSVCERLSYVSGM